MGKVTSMLQCFKEKVQMLDLHMKYLSITTGLHNHQKRIINFF